MQHLWSSAVGKCDDSDTWDRMEVGEESGVVLVISCLSAALTLQWGRH